MHVIQVAAKEQQLDLSKKTIVEKITILKIME